MSLENFFENWERSNDETAKDAKTANKKEKNAYENVNGFL